MGYQALAIIRYVRYLFAIGKLRAVTLLVLVAAVLTVAGAER